MKSILFKRTIALSMMDGWLCISKEGKHHQFLEENAFNSPRAIARFIDNKDFYLEGEENRWKSSGGKAVIK